MPANLTPDYERAEERYRQAQTDEERLEALREMYATVPKHKGTEKLQADLKRRISQCRKTVARKPSRGPDPFHIPRSGAGQIVLFGAPNCGKSLLVSRTTHAPVKVTDYPFATSLPVPGMWPYKDVQIELVDTPPVAAQHVPAGLWNTVRSCDVLGLMIDAADEPLEQAEMLLGLMRERSLVLRTAPTSELDPSDFNQHCAILIANKVDLVDAGTVETLAELYASPALDGGVETRGSIEVIGISALTGQGLEILAERLWQLLAVVRVYTKQPGHPPDKSKPFTLPVGSTVEDLAREIHRELPERMKYARIWGDGRFSGQQVHRTEVLHDEDVVEIHQ